MDKLTKNIGLMYCIEPENESGDEYEPKIIFICVPYVKCIWKFPYD